MLKNNNDQYGSVAKIFHWLMGILIIAMLAVGLYMTGLPAGPDKSQIYGIHKAVGAIILALVVIRFIWRNLNIVPLLPSTLPNIYKMLAHGAHMSLYALMIIMPMSGWIMSSAAGYPVSVFGLFNLPDLVSKDPVLREMAGFIHTICAYLLIGLLVLHIAAALKHHFIDKDNVFRRMLP